MSNQTFIPTRTCPICGNTGEITMSVDDAEHGANLRWAGALIQEAYPNTSAPEREQIMTGTHPKCWDAMFNSDWDNDE